MVREQLNKLGVPLVVFNQRRFASIEMYFEISRGQVLGQIRMENRSCRLEDFHGVYMRPMDFRHLPELWNEPPNSPKRQYCYALHDTLMRWCEIGPARVVNRASHMGSNYSKPYQAQLIREQGFAVPETLITNDPNLVHEFRNRHKRVIYKSISGIRSIVQTLEDKDLERLDHIRWCPTQFQEYVEGTNVRVHTLDTKVFATSVSADATDYRYAYLRGRETQMKPIELPDELAERCVRLSQGLGLAFAGIDLKIAPDDRVFCFEVNPGPAFSYYEANTGQPIAQAVARYLAGAD
jgi:glutathione synthase/RimK-type ligase-like ATP-grasp enzyme